MIGLASSKGRIDQVGRGSVYLPRKSESSPLYVGKEASAATRRLMLEVGLGQAHASPSRVAWKHRTENNREATRSMRAFKASKSCHPRDNCV